MITYIKNSISKLKNDALSKGLYDTIKWLFISQIILTASNWIPFLKAFPFLKVELKIFWLITLTIATIIITILLVRRHYNKRINQVKADNHTDELTGLKNYKALKEHLTELIISPQSHPLSLIIIDIDSFKDFNTKMGHLTADKILQKLGELLGNDKRATDETFRFFLRGDEFIVVAKSTNQNQAFQAAERKRNLIENNSFEIENQLYSLTVSCGVTELKDKDNYDSIIERVVKSLNLAKLQPGKNCTKMIS